MNFPTVYQFKQGVSKETHLLKLLCNIYGQKQAGRVWNQYLNQGLSDIEFQVSKVDPCLYYWNGVVLLVYINDCTMFSPDINKLSKVVQDMQKSRQKFRVEDLGEVHDFLGIKIRKQNDGSIELTQPHPNQFHSTRPAFPG